VRSGRMIHVCNVPSPAATASLEIGKEIVDMLVQQFDLAPKGAESLAH
jgi:(S)-2-hydroxyglutarate dehydrogenase